MARNKISPPHHPHDRYIRSMMSHPKVIQEFFEANLPAKIKDAMDFSAIELQKESYVDDKLHLQIADLLYKVNFQGEAGYLYVLMEHASTPDPLLPFRMLKYMTAIMDAHLAKTAAKKLPVIYPLILYTGSRPFLHSLDLFDLFGSQKLLAREIFQNPYHLIDLTQACDEDLQKYLWFGTVALIAKHIHDPDIFPFFESILQALKALEEQGESGYIYTAISYIVEAGEVSDKEKFIKMLTTGLETVDEEKIMTIAEQLRPEIYKKSKEEGRLEGKQEVAFNLLKLGMDIYNISEATGLSVEEIEDLKDDQRYSVH